MPAICLLESFRPAPRRSGTAEPRCPRLHLSMSVASVRVSLRAAIRCSAGSSGLSPCLPPGRCSCTRHRSFRTSLEGVFGHWPPRPAPAKEGSDCAQQASRRTAPSEPDPTEWVAVDPVAAGVLVEIRAWIGVLSMAVTSKLLMPRAAQLCIICLRIRRHLRQGGSASQNQDGSESKTIHRMSLGNRVWQPCPLASSDMHGASFRHGTAISVQALLLVSLPRQHGISVFSRTGKPGIPKQKAAFSLGKSRLLHCCKSSE